MDDIEFTDFSIFDQTEWFCIIDKCIEIADIKIQKIINKLNAYNQPQKLVPFKKRNSD